jgi:hypothetical protein
MYSYLLTIMQIMHALCDNHDMCDVTHIWLRVIFRVDTLILTTDFCIWNGAMLGETGYSS